jgi:peptidoglycan/LPS O-acetylase OafA/YrhL
MQSKKLFKLEALRGIASIIVFFWHFTISFLPDLVIPKQGNAGIMGTPFFFLLNGHASVMIFFLLSGFVLTIKYYTHDDLSVIVSGTIKRYFRLIGPVAITIIFSYLLFVLNLYLYKEAGLITKSQWLMDFAGSDKGGNFKPSLISALRQAFIRVFLTGETYYCSSLWTMKYELIGSFIAMFLAPVFLKSNKPQRFIALIIFSYIAGFYSPNYIGFIAGSYLAYYYSKHPVIIIPVWLKAIMIFMALSMLSYNLPVGFFACFGWLSNLFNNADYFIIYIQFIGALLLLYVFLSKDKVLDLFNGKAGRWLGALSFPLYLVQLMVFCSFSSWLIVVLQDKIHSYYGLIAITFLATIIVIAFAVMLLIYFDKIWTRFINNKFSLNQLQTKNTLPSN